MRILTFLSSIALLLILFTTTSPLTSCTKEVIIRDTVTLKDTLTIIDTITIKDTITIIDSSCANCYDLKKGLIAYYDFTDGSLDDLSGKNNHIVFNNATKTTDRFGKPNNAYLFNGSSSYMQVNNSTSLNPKHISIMAIVNIKGFYSGNCDGNAIVAKGWPDNSTGFYTLRFQDINNDCSITPDFTKEIFVGGFQGTGTYQYPNSYIAKDTWYNVVFTFDGNISNLYVNGELKSTHTQTEDNLGNSHELLIGKTGHAPFPYWFNGIMDEIRIYDRALCEAEVKALNLLKN